MKPLLKLLLVPLCLCPSLAQAQPDPDRTPVVVNLTVRSAPPPRPALKHALLPTLIDQTPGNAAQLYMMGNHVLLQSEFANKSDLVKQWLDKPLAEAMKDRSVPQMVPHNALALYRRASHREYCRWETTARDEGFSALLPYLNQMPPAALMVAVHARTQMAEGKLDDALATLRIGVALASHLDEDAVLVQLLVAARVFDITSDQLQVLIQQPDSPNLYWALAQLPRPFIEPSRVTQFEKYALELTFPALKDLDNLSLAEARRIMTEMPAILGPGNPSGGISLQWGLSVIAAYPRAQAFLIARGMPEARVSQMPPHQVLIRYYIADYHEALDDVAKWFPLPYPQAFRGMRAAETAAARAERRDNPLVAMLTPALSRARQRLAAIDRKIVMLMAIEALRAHAAAHDGKLPAKLSDLDDTMPIPPDPLTGQPLDYQVNGNTAILQTAAPEGALQSYKWRYEVTIQR